MTVLGHLRALAVALSASGCILLVSPVDPGDHCQIKGGTTCATCIREKCQPAVDACCSATACTSSSESSLSTLGGDGDVLVAVDACGNGDRNACFTRLSTPRLGAEEEAIRSCVVSSCHAECVEGGTRTGDTPGRPTWTCGLPRLTEKDCAACIYGACEAKLDACCADSSCSKDGDLQKDMGACVAGDEPGCAYLLEQSTSGLAGIVRGCITDSCAARCMGDGRPHASCTPYAGGDYCACSDAEASKGPECSAAEVGGHCVRGDKGCTCGAYSCESASRGCTCDFHGGGGQTSCSPSGGRCCIKLTDRGVSCECDSSATSCYTSLREFDIASCDLATVLSDLREAERVVTTCSR